MQTTPPRATSTRFWTTHALLPLLAVTALLVVFESTRLDRALLDPFYDPATRKFPLRDTAWFTLVFKDGLKAVIIVLGVLVAFGLVLSFRKRELVPWRRSMLYVVLAMALSPLVVAAFKYTSCKHCPWDLDFYGGPAPYAGLLGCPPPSFGLGKCFPSGHASGGFALFALYFAHRIHAPQRARLWLLVALAYGFLMGTSRMMQGAHFMSHNVATAFTCWTVCLVLYVLILRRYDERRFASGASANARSSAT
ncbi:MAG: phosphatase PAP2 family protein [Planctomycetes bacterium]|nr:phosphatase PAP2 family protein [Planctomycetota bacterium]